MATTSGNPHKWFPFGVNCCHCHQWYQLAFYVHHVEQIHPKCAQCGMDQYLASGMLEEMLASAREARRQHTSAPNGAQLEG